MVANIEAQNIYSPYSVLGVGDINTMDLTHNIAMGGVGISTGTHFISTTKILLC